MGNSGSDESEHAGKQVADKQQQRHPPPELCQPVRQTVTKCDGGCDESETLAVGCTRVEKKAEDDEICDREARCREKTNNKTVEKNKQNCGCSPSTSKLSKMLQVHATLIEVEPTCSSRLLNTKFHFEFGFRLTTLEAA